MESLTFFTSPGNCCHVVLTVYSTLLLCVLETVIKSDVTGSYLCCLLSDPHIVSQLSRFSPYQHHQDHRLHVCSSNMITSLEQLRNSLHELPSGSLCVCACVCVLPVGCVLSFSLSSDSYQLMKTHANAWGYVAALTGYFLVPEWLQLLGEKNC